MGGKDNEPNAEGVFSPLEGGAYSGSPSNAQSKRHNLIWGGVSVFLLLNIIALYILHFVDRGNSGDSVTGTFSTSDLSANAQSASKGQAVSYTTDGQLTPGAGTTAYLSATTLPSEDQYLAYIKFAPLGTSESAYASNIISFQTGTSPDISATVTVLTTDADTKTVSIADAGSSNIFSGSTVKGLTTLSDTLATALTTVTDESFTTTTSVTPVKISDGSISVQQSQTAVAYNTSSTTFMTRVSDTSFALVYYESYLVSPYYQRIVIGTVADDGSISFSDSLEFGNANDATLTTTFGTPQSVFNTSNTVTVPWYVDASSSTNGTSSSVGSVVSPIYFVDSAKISETVIALSYFDTANNYALTVSLVEFSSISGSPSFRGSYVIDESMGKIDFGSATGFYPTPIVRMLPNNRLAVGFLNPANSGKPSIKVLTYSSDLTLSEESPVLPVANADFSVASADPKAAGSIVLDVVATETGALIGYAGLWAGSQNQRVALVESYGKPVGIVSNVDGSDLDVALSGTVDVSSSSLVKGTTYYSSTEGTLYAASTASTNNYILANDNSIVISKDALVGVAISDAKLVVTV
ncbi:hypothetical protein BBO99_00001960 [Phytophthora kernoviae]|uniref:Uncharacterized protein n=2 Tax=Phytophthora kernoviae TaxID=325452 RepID=A0A3R7JXH6_9STRA|nr:hypothetical protein G195_002509 [Phytophthora kernoviae 00238/432]KAG2530191.1 hypothetical protein JM16_001641 [Phytophthora kernoviae]KAG2530302.1 hypothetical protein JM18_001811 [Phytophthora kernoviae]RLN20239.1 hypothetical protein BBI17_001990 [Phytophthora kernoviae]RLN83571.1 hypothetical protein BBO99_00001960 [Phytophthora kernoviae]